MENALKADTQIATIGLANCGLSQFIEHPNIKQSKPEIIYRYQKAVDFPT